MSLVAAGRLRIGELELELELRAAAGDVVALVGQNGSGKSSTLRAIAGLAQLVEGQICVADRVVDDADSELFVPAQERNVGLLFQDPLLFPHLDVLDNVGFSLRARGQSKRDSRLEAAEWLERLGVGSLAARRPTELSGGQAQRVALVRALSAEPDVLLLDEPLSSLDPGARDDVVTWLGTHLESFSGVAVVVSHDPDVVASLCTEIYSITQNAKNRLGPSMVSPSDSESVALLMAGR